MSDIDNKRNRTPESSRRLLLRVLTKGMVAVSLLVGVWIVLSPLFKTNTTVNAKIVETRINVTDLAPGSVDIIEWFDKPLIIAHRKSTTESKLAAIATASLSDAENKRSLQPDFANNPLRSAEPGWFVAIGIGTSSGCALRPPDTAAATREFVDVCDGSRYDLAGRALAGLPAVKNLPVPHWRLEAGHIIVSTRRIK